MIIGLCGLIGSGKDSVAEFLVEKHNFKRLAFADTLKDVACLLFDFDRNMIEGKDSEQRKIRESADEYWSKKFGFDFSPRLSLQMIGDGLRQVTHPDLWIWKVENELKKYENVVISDVRYPNEVNMIKKNGGKIWNIFRETPEWFNTAWTKNYHLAGIEPTGEFRFFEYNGKRIHYSEWAMIGYHFDKTIDNKGSLELLYSEIERALGK